MTTQEEVEKYWQDHLTGQPVLEKLFELKTDKLLALLRDVLHDDKFALGVLNNKASITKTIVNDKPKNIMIRFYDELLIDSHGISTYRRVLVKFDKFFNIDKIK